MFIPKSAVVSCRSPCDSVYNESDRGERGVLAAVAAVLAKRAKVNLTEGDGKKAKITQKGARSADRAQ